MYSVRAEVCVPKCRAFILHFFLSVSIHKFLSIYKYIYILLCVKL